MTGQMIRLLAMLLAIALLAGCVEPDAEWQQGRTEGVMSAQDDDRISITRVAIFRDRLAYANERGVYVITDKKTGREFIGISGIGISETGAHTTPAGRAVLTVEDER